MAEKKKERELTPWYGGFIGTIMYELVEEEGQPFYLKITNDSIETINRVEVEDDIFIPPSKMPFRLPHTITQEDVKKVDISNLHTRIIHYIDKYLEVPHDDDLFILATWIMCTWTKEYYTVTPYLHFIGPKESGKTRAGEVMSKITRRGVQTASPTEASVAYSLHHIDVTLFIDEQEQKQLEDQRLVPLLDSGYKRGQYYMRCEGEKMNVRDVSWLRTWGFKSFSSRDEYVDMLESRCFTVPMKKCMISRPYEIRRSEVEELIHDLLCMRVKFFQEGLLRSDELVDNGDDVVPKKDAQKTSDDYAVDLTSVQNSDDLTKSDEPILNKPNSSECQELVRCIPAHYNPDTEPKTQSSDDLTDRIEREEGGYKMNIKEHKDCTVFIGSRLEELFLTPLKMAGKSSETLKNKLEKIQKKMLQIKKEDDFFTTEATIISAFIEVVDQNHEEEPTSQQIADIINRDIAKEKDKYSSVYVCRVMKRMGFGQKRNSKGNKRIWIIDRVLMEQLKKRFIDLRRDDIPESGGLNKFLNTTPPNPTTSPPSPEEIKNPPYMGAFGVVRRTALEVMDYLNSYPDGVTYDELRGNLDNPDLDSVLAELVKRGDVHEYKKGNYRVALK